MKYFSEYRTFHDVDANVNSLTSDSRLRLNITELWITQLLDTVTNCEVYPVA